MYKGPNRKNTRMKNFDYSENGYYFVTICTKNRENKFGEIVGTDMILNEYGKIVEKCWFDIINHYNVEIDYFVVMPNHVHGIIGIGVGNENFRSLQDRNANLSNIIKGFKIGITKEIRNIHNDFTFSWQKSFYDRIIRDENELLKIREYIENNPLKWHLDKNNLL